MPLRALLPVYEDDAVLAPDLLQNRAVRAWLGDVLPAWTLLDQTCLSRLRHPPLHRNGAIRLATDLTPHEISQSAVTGNALILLHAAAEKPGLKLTATGNLSRKVVLQMFETFTWPELDKAEMLRFNKVLNEQDFLPLFMVHHFVAAAQLVRKHKEWLRITSAGRHVLESPGRDALQALLFHVAFWVADLSYLGRELLNGWPQQDIGVVLWSLSSFANEWQPTERLTRICTIPTNAVVTSQWDAGSYAMVARVLRPLLCFGMLEHRSESIPGRALAERHFYRKTPLFDRFLSFDVKVEGAGMPRH